MSPTTTTSPMTAYRCCHGHTQVASAAAGTHPCPYPVNGLPCGEPAVPVAARGRR